MIKVFDSKDLCCGCGACYEICPQNAITMVEDQFGFLYPEIKSESCVNCRKCKTVCAFQNPLHNESLKISYVAVTGNTDILFSTSGGVFSSLAKSVLENNGVVYGCELVKDNNSFIAKHTSVSKIDQLINLQGSKYIQSTMENTYTHVKEDLSAQKNVLFCGTPCQVAALKSFLEHEYSNLYTLDLVCHGVPNVKFFNDYIKHLEKGSHRRVSRFQFRNKKNGWQHSGEYQLTDTRNNSIKMNYTPKNSSFYDLYLESYICRDSCYNCPYASANRPGDITIGDYWGINMVHPELLKSKGGCIDHGKGVSCLVINNDRGLEMLKTFGDGLQIWKSSFEKVSEYNDRLRTPIKMPHKREQLFELYSMKGYKMVEKWYQKEINKDKQSLYNKMILKIRFLPEIYKMPFKKFRNLLMH